MRGEGGRYALLAWVLTCDTCGTECWNDGAQDQYARYVPDPWHTNEDGTHACPDCQSRAATGHTVGCLNVSGPDNCASPTVCARTAT